MTLTIQNETDWDGRDLRTLCRRVIEHTDGYFGRRIRVYTGRPKHIPWENLADEAEEPDDPVRPGRYAYHGYAFYPPSKRIRMGVPKPFREIDGETVEVEFEPEWFARVLVHEVAHNRGLKHGDMKNALRHCTAGLDVSYVDGIEVRPKPSVRERIVA